ncbi:sulfite exporter TauE/SafE family protein [Saccharospirillum alexandrii]|uniref:urease accessory protein UreH domain-containing protein n=1 Tax=Saccharospirillum alexandrii TaxID=2448477 RepID=UPI00373582FF
MRRPRHISTLRLGYSGGRIVSYMSSGASAALVAKVLNQALYEAALVLRPLVAVLLIIIGLS